MTETQAEIKRLYEQGKENQEIADILGIGLNKVNYQIYQKIGLQSKCKKVTIKEINTALEYKRKKFNRSLICKRMGIDIHRLKRVLEYAK